MPSISRGLHKWLLQGGATLDDMADRLSHVWTVALLLVLGTIISWKHGYSEPIACWTPAEFTNSHNAYANKMCWQMPVIVTMDGTNMPLVSGKGSFNEIEMKQSTDGRIKHDDINTTLYQWVPLILCLQALLFKLPNILMYIFHGYSGLSFEKIRSLTDGFEALNMEDRMLLGRQTAHYLHGWLNGRLVKLPYRTFTVIWLVVKLCYVSNAIIQLVLVDKFLSTKEIDNATSYGELIYDNFQEENITLFRESPVFPRKVMCEMSVPMLNRVYRYTLTCTLPGNMFAEHAYTFLWVWLVFVAVVSVCSLMAWLFRRIVPVFRTRYIQQFLDMANPNDPKTVSYPGFGDFSHFYLGEDGMFVLKLIGYNSSDLLVKDIVKELWTIAGYSDRPAGVAIARATATAPPENTVDPLFPEQAGEGAFQAAESKID